MTTTGTAKLKAPHEVKDLALSGPAKKRAARDLSAKKSGTVLGGRDAASGLPTGKRQSKPLFP